MDVCVCSLAGGAPWQLPGPKAQPGAVAAAHCPEEDTVGGRVPLLGRARLIVLASKDLRACFCQTAFVNEDDSDAVLTTCHVMHGSEKNRQASVFCRFLLLFKTATDPTNATPKMK